MKVYANAKGTEIAFIVCIYPGEKGKKEAITVEPLYYGHPWDQLQCPDYWGCPHFRGQIVHIHMSWDQKVMSLLVRCPYFRDPD